jgi:hypothetical protein
MPNWVAHRLAISGDEMELKRFASCFVTAKEGDLFPQYFSDEFHHGQPLARRVGELFFSFDHLVPPPEDSDSWVLARWGSRYVACMTEIEMLPEAIELSFCTAWSFGLTIYEELAELFPRLTIEGEIFEPMMEFGGHVRCYAGKIDYEDKSEQIKAEMAEFYAKLDRERAVEPPAPVAHPDLRDEDIPF